MAIGIPLTRPDLADLTNLDIFDNVTGEISGYKLLKVLLHMQASAPNLLTDGYVTGNPGAPINPDYQALLQAINLKADQLFVVSELGGKEAKFNGLLVADLNADKADYAGLGLYPLLVKIVNALGNVNAGPVPATPTNLRATASTSSTLTLAWDAVAGTYTLQRAPVDNQGVVGTFATVYTGTAKTYQDAGLTYMAIYAYRVKVTVNGVDSQYSQQYTTGNQKLPAPTGLTATVASSTQINLTWNAIPNATSSQVYQLQRAPVTNGTVGSFVAIHSGLDTFYSDTGRTPGTTYAYRVVATTNGNYATSDPSATVMATASDKAGTYADPQYGTY